MFPACKHQQKSCFTRSTHDHQKRIQLLLQGGTPHSATKLCKIHWSCSLPPIKPTDIWTMIFAYGNLFVICWIIISPFISCSPCFPPQKSWAKAHSFKPYCIELSKKGAVLECRGRIFSTRNSPSSLMLVCYRAETVQRRKPEPDLQSCFSWYNFPLPFVA